MRDVFRPWPGALRGSNWREDRRTACARSVNFMPAPLAEEDPQGAGGRRRQHYLQPTPGILTSATGRWWPPKHPARAMLGTPDGILIVAGAGAAEPGSLYALFGALGEPGVDPRELGVLAGSPDWDAATSNTPPPLAQIAWGGPQVGIIAVAANGKLGYYDQRTTTWFPDILGNALASGREAGQQAAVVGVQFFNNYFFILDDENRLFASPVLGRGTATSTARPGGGGQIPLYAFDLTNQVQRSLEPDPWIAMLALSDRLLMFGRQSMGTWQLKADPGTEFPLERILGGQYQSGVFAQGAIAAMGDKAYWVGQTPQGQVRAYRFGGEGGVEAISSAAVDEYLNAVRRSSREAVRCTATALAGRLCFAMRFDDYRAEARRERLGATWCFDETTGLWHERGVWNEDARRWDQWEVVFATTFAERPYAIADDPSPEAIDRGGGAGTTPAGSTMVGWMTTERVVDGEWTDSILSGKLNNPDNPRERRIVTPASSGFIRRERITPHWGTRAALQSVRGVKISTGRGGGDVDLSLSTDGGETYGAAHRRSPGPGVEELRWFNLGMARDPVLKLRMTGRSAALNNVWANIIRLRN